MNGVSNILCAFERLSFPPFFFLPSILVFRGHIIVDIFFSSLHCQTYVSASEFFVFSVNVTMGFFFLHTHSLQFALCESMMFMFGSICN